MLQIDVYSSRAVIRSQEPLTVGMVGAKAHIHFAEPWQTLTKTVVFRQGEVTRDVVGVTEAAEIPWEVLQQPGEPVQIGFYGSKSNGSVVIPTVWVETEPVSEGADPSGDPSTAATLPVYQQLQEQIEAADQQLQNQITNKSLLAVAITRKGDTLIADKSFSEINAAVHGVGRFVVCTYAGRVYLLSEMHVQDQLRFSSVWLRGDKYVLGNLTITSAEEVSVSEQELPPGEKLRSIVSTYDADMAALNGRLDEHAGSIDALNTQTQALEEQLSGVVRRSDVQILQFTGLEEPVVYDPVGDSVDPITVDLSQIGAFIHHGEMLEQLGSDVSKHDRQLGMMGDALNSGIRRIEELDTRLDEVEGMDAKHDHQFYELQATVDSQAQSLDELYGFSQDYHQDIEELGNRLDEVEEALENAGQGGTGGGGSYELPVATPDTLGGVQPVAKTDEMTNPVGVDNLGGLWSAGGRKETVLIEFTAEEDVSEVIIPLDENAVKAYNASKDVFLYFKLDRASADEATAIGTCDAFIECTYGSTWLTAASLLSDKIVPTNAISYIPSSRGLAHLIKSWPVNPESRSAQYPDYIIKSYFLHNQTSTYRSSASITRGLFHDASPRMRIISSHPIGKGSYFKLVVRG